MYTRPYCILILSGSLLASANAFAQVDFRPRVSLGMASYDIEINFNDGSSPTAADSTYLKAGIGAAMITGRWYFDFGYGGSIYAEAEDDVGATFDFVRSDLTLTAGYVFPSNFTVFGGYKTGTSEFTGDPTCPGCEIKFEADGIYGGAGYNIPVDGNVFSINAAVAVLNGELALVEPGLPTFTDESGTVGVSLGAGYKISMSNTSGFTLKAIAQSYRFKEFDSLQGLATDETIISLDFGYYTVF